MDALVQGGLSVLSAATNVSHDWGGFKALFAETFEINMISGMMSGTKWGKRCCWRWANYAVAMHTR
jgi:hypothetical protein